jgi:hypothetical protein
MRSGPYLASLALCSILVAVPATAQAITRTDAVSASHIALDVLAEAMDAKGVHVGKCEFPTPRKARCNVKIRGADQTLRAVVTVLHPRRDRWLVGVRHIVVH